jgi:diguanylate cyclase (GGDEF)-like protein
VESNKVDTPELSDHEAFSQTITQLDRCLTRSWASTIAELTTVFATIAVSLFFANKFLSTQQSATVLVNGFAFLLLACNAYRVFQYRQIKKVHNDLTAQLRRSIQQRRRADKLYNLSIQDPLTGLHNRRFGEERLQEEIERAEKNSDPLAVIILDLDHFKQINDQFGHAAGDAALRSFSNNLKRAIRACDVAVRIGGDEFLVVLPDCPREKVDVILSRLGSPQVQINSEMRSIGYSVGRAHYQVSDTIKSLLKRADDVLYAQKQARPKLSRSASASNRGVVDDRKLTPGQTCSVGEFTSLPIDLRNQSFVA